MKKEELSFLSSDGITNIRAVKYLPDNKPIAILQISHGMIEYIDRYDGFAKFLNEKGILVVGNDHLGHGESVIDKEKWGYFAKEDGYKKVVDDLHQLTLITKKEYPNIPYILLGHSMGSFMARRYLYTYGNELDGAIIMGTGQQDAATLSLAGTICKILGSMKGEMYRSEFITSLALGPYNKKWEPSKTHNDWLTKDEKIVSSYSIDPKCTFRFTVNGYKNLFGVLKDIIQKDNLNKMPKDLPVLFVSGEDDPVGNFTKGVNKAYQSFIDAGMKNVSVKFYPNDRHEILNELDKENVMSDLYDFIKKVVD